ncbi:DUF2252 domain-containing protein [Demequina sp.]|uniref:DUF2252 domain-containing protein n=1 Tax=Demequina sp. TaxID=2050685 RepID=UPI0025E6C24B|nr:DUF2252 domain-containing protein [Demequina sp.]
MTRYDDDRSRGQALRHTVPRSTIGDFALPEDRDPLAIIESQHASRIPELIPVRVARLGAGPFAFFRGTAAVQAADLAACPSTGITVAMVGDAHVSNFGLLAAEDRSLVFDVNDFDEATFGPWEWDLKRLVSSVWVACEERGLAPAKTERAARAAARSYRETLLRTATLSPLEVYTLRARPVSTEAGGEAFARAVADAVRRAEKRTPEKALSRIVKPGSDGQPHVAEHPPEVVAVSGESRAEVEHLLGAYRATVSPDVALLLHQFTVTAAARFAVGVGSVGTRCYVVVLAGPHGEPLILQIKEAGPSVIHEFGNVPAAPPTSLDGDPADFEGHGGRRVTSLQRILQSVYDPFLGWFEVDDDSFYVRRFHDVSASIEMDSLTPASVADYGAACGILLARAHSQSPALPIIAGYLGAGRSFDPAVADWGRQYASLVRQDHAGFVDAVAAGRFGTTP